MDAMNAIQTRNLIIWAALYVCAQLLYGLTPSMMRLGAKKTDPTAGAALFALTMAVGSCGLAAFEGKLSALWTIDNRTLTFVILAGALSALTWLSLYTALTGGLCSKVLPIVNLSTVAVLVSSHFLLHTALGLWRLCCIVLILLGTVLIESRTKGARSKLWMLYAGLAMLFYTATNLVQTLYLANLDAALIEFGRSTTALVLLVIFLFARGKQKTFDRMNAASWIATPAAALCRCGGTTLCYLAAQRGDLSLLAPVTLVAFGSMMLFARLILKERQPGSALFGTLLVLLGMFAILMGW